MKLNDLLKSKGVSDVVSSFDVIGNIAVINVDKSIERVVGKSIMGLHKNVLTVVNKVGKINDGFRLQKIQFVVGKKSFSTIHVENGLRLKVKVGSVYFSPRLSTERNIIIRQARIDERVLDLFCGVGPFSVGLAKKGCEVFSVEWNPLACNLLKENFELNKVKGKIFCGDAHTVKIKGVFDRVIMNSPSNSYDFLKRVFREWVKKGSIIHFYTFGNEYEFANEKNMIKNHQKKIKEIAKSSGKTIKFLTYRKTAQTSKRSYRIVIDLKIVKKTNVL